MKALLKSIHRKSGARKPHGYLVLYYSALWTISAVFSALFAGENISFERFYPELNYGGNGKPGWVRAGDMDNDGDIDLVAGGGKALFIYENDGSARGWRRHGSLDGTGEIGSNGGVLYDVDGDSDLDLVAARYKTDPGWWENPGGRLRTAGWTFHALDDEIKDYFTHDVILADLDGDGKVEEFVFCLTKAGYWDAPVKIFWYRPAADPCELWLRHAIAEDKPCPDNNHAGLDVADLDRDGNPDLAFSNGWFEAPDDPGSGPWKWHEIVDIYGVSNSLARDLDGDGDPDLVISAGHHGKGVFWLANPGDPTSSEWTTYAIDSTVNHPEGLQALDLDGDGSIEIIAAELFFGEAPGEPGWDQEVHNVYLYLNLGGNPPAWTKINIAPDSYPSHQLQVADVNQDGKPDILGNGCGYKVIGYYENTGGQPGKQ